MSSTNLILQFKNVSFLEGGVWTNLHLAIEAYKTPPYQKAKGAMETIKLKDYVSEESFKSFYKKNGNPISVGDFSLKYLIDNGEFDVGPLDENGSIQLIFKEQKSAKK